MTDTAQLIADKENELDIAEGSLGIVEENIDIIRRKIIMLKLEKDELEIRIKKLILEIEPLKPEQRKGSRNLERMRREHKSLIRQLFRENRGI